MRLRGPKKDLRRRLALPALLTALSLSLAGCSSSEEPAPPAPVPGEDASTVSPGAPPAPGEAVPGEDPSPGGESGEGNGDEPGPAPPEPGAPTVAAFDEENRGAEPVEGLHLPELLLARNQDEAARLADKTPISGPDALVQGWGEYGSRSLVVFLGGSQPDASYGLEIRSTQVIRDGTVLVLFGKVTRKSGAAASVRTMPWVVLSVEAGAVDVVSRCVLSLKGSTPRATSCP